jgi:predicted aspartyl protease
LAGLLIAMQGLLIADGKSEAAPLITRMDDSVSVPAEISGHQMFVNIMVNGHGPFRVMVDTGCSLTLVSPELAEAVGATVLDAGEDFVVAENGLGDPTEVQRVVLGTMDLGGVCFEGVPAAVSDSFERLSMIEGRRVDGALGFPLFADLFLGLDFPNQRLLLGRNWPANAPTIRASLPVIEHADVPFVQVKIQGKAVDVMIDTGANQALQLPLELASLLEWKVEPRAGSLVAVIGEVGKASDVWPGVCRWEISGKLNPPRLCPPDRPASGSAHSSASALYFTSPKTGYGSAALTPRRSCQPLNAVTGLASTPMRVAGV